MEAVRVCHNGHIKKAGHDPQSPLTASEVVDVDVGVNVSSGGSYCGKCGADIIWRCENCDTSILIEYNRSVPATGDLPNHCRACGELYPWVDPVQQAEQREGEFLAVEDSNITGQFYPSLVYEINLCYRVQADEAAMILTRKLLENLLIDILRGHFGIEENRMFYRPENRQHKSLGDLIEVFEQNTDELDQYSTADEDLILEKLNEIKYSGDASAHSIEQNISEGELDELSEGATWVAKVLFRIRREVATAHRNST